ncbi:uncharacterized protein LOC106647990 isoform X2 [Trichogramma pretiosum]|uniref:uncharacterized protein LOC106647990 isoform X2 n=1 Tax=Trichogramma pretiosum TaxID=7493 RepID=UPI0006C9CE8F|nr:uncharacterized protein LOC106647990 isoform X2 [Trichogramma pretiosum]
MSQRAQQPNPRYAYLPCPAYDDADIIGGSQQDQEEQRYGTLVGPRRTSGGGPHQLKWGGQQPANANYTNNNLGGNANLLNNNNNNINNYGGSAQPQPVQRRKTGSVQHRPGGDDLPLTPTTASRQVSFHGKGSSLHGGQYGSVIQTHQSSSSPARSEPISLATLDKDCFIIPLAALERFLPAGVPRLPSADKRRPGSPLSVLEVEDPKQCILAHFMTSMEPIDPLVESPVSKPLVLQRDTAAELLTELAPAATQSILLTNMERNADFPFIAYYVVNKQKTEPVDFYQEVQCAALKKFDPRDLRYAANHNLDLFNEVATIARPPLEPLGGRPPIPSTGYIVSIFKVFEGDDGLKFEQNWLYWTGARMMYRYLPKNVGLRRITLHKSMSAGDKTYLLVCECSQLQENLSAAAILLPALRARLCGYVGLYRPSVCF